MNTALQGWGLRQKIFLLGVRHDVPRLMQSADLLLFPSVAEGLGMVAVEAQAAGLRVLASDAVPRECCVLPDQVKFRSLEDGAECWAVEAARLLRLERSNTSTCNAAVRSSGFSIDNSATRLLRLYRNQG